MTQRDGKRLIAYSSISHIALSLLLLFTLYSLSFEGFTLVRIFHMVVRGRIFFFIGLFFYLLLRRRIPFLKGVGFILMLILILSANIGSPPLLSFMREVIHLRGISLFSPLFRGPLLLYLLFRGYFRIFLFYNLSYPSMRVNLLPTNLLLFLFILNLLSVSYLFL
jgi:NADH:ubiquinone oxidoreductase subunit 4 (subunit M)